MPRLPLPVVPRLRQWVWAISVLLLLAGAGIFIPLSGLGHASTAPTLAPRPPRATADTGDVTQGALRVTRGDQLVECPLRHTDVRAEVSGFIARVRVTQTFENPYDEPIEAVYVFPLSNGGAVDEMTMVVGGRRISGVVKRRREAREDYEQAIAQGQTASLLEQERPNIFTQSVGNIPARQTVKVEIAYVDVLPYEGGRYEFHFPMVVGPRYIPGRASARAEVNSALPRSFGGATSLSAQPPHGPSGLPPSPAPSGDGWAPDTDRVPDASRITPPVLKPGFRNGHDVSLAVTVEAGVPIRGLDVHDHDATVQRASASAASVTLSPRDSVPNKDFVLSYAVAGPRPETAVLTHAVPGEDGYFLLMMQPRDVEEALRVSPPRDVCFLIDVSGSMSGQPMAKVTEAMERFFERMRPQDRLQVVTFAGQATPLFPRYLPVEPATVAEALKLTREMKGGGGTEMLRGIQMVMADPVDSDRVRIVVMLTDGYIGNEDEIIGEVGRRAGDQMRFWTVGIGSSPNRHLIDGVARQGGGMSAVLGLEQDPTEMVGRIMDRVQRAQLSRVDVDWGGMDVVETYPTRIGELWAGRPVFLLGRYRGEGEATLTLSGLAEGQPVSFAVPVSLAAPSSAAGAHAVLAKAWARKKIEHLDDQMAVAGASEDMVEEITGVALQYQLMSAYTSFVAVDERRPEVEPAAPPRRMLVPVPLPAGVSYEGVFGHDGFEDKDEGGFLMANMAAAPAFAKGRGVREKRQHRADARKAIRVGGALYRAAPRPQPAGVPLGVEGGVPGGVVGGVVGGMVGGLPVEAPAPPAPPPPPSMVVAREMVMADSATRTRVAPGAAAQGERIDPLQRKAHSALQDGKRRQTGGDLDGAARDLALAATLEQGRLRRGGADDGTLGSALSELAAVTRAREEQAARVLPALQRPLAMILRNTDLGSALAAVAAAAGLELDVAPGKEDSV